MPFIDYEDLDLTPNPILTPNSDSHELDSLSATPLPTEPAEADTPSTRFVVPSTQRPRAPRLVKTPAPTGPALGLSQSLSGLRNSRLHGLISCRLRPWDSWRILRRPAQHPSPVHGKPHNRSQYWSASPHSVGPKPTIPNDSRSLWHVPPLKYRPTVLRTGSHRRTRDRNLSSAPSEENVLPLMSLGNH